MTFLSPLSLPPPSPTMSESRAVKRISVGAVSHQRGGPGPIRSGSAAVLRVYFQAVALLQQDFQ